jgi:hypothetical protein
MATGTVKVLVAVEIPLPTSNVEKLKGAEINKELRDTAEEKVLEALNSADLQPTILRVRVARGDKD